MPTEESEKIIRKIVNQLRETGMRKTEALEELLQTMLDHHRPFLLSELGEMPGLKNRDQATIYRLVMKLKEAGVVRQLSLGERGNYFQINLSDHHHDYLLCRECGMVTEVPVECVLHEVEQKLAARHGWKDLTHSLAFQGICPECLAKP
ncbi:MAG: transcriptional repressor [Verrucomicrobiales bacterium]|nr:transcriptional repressor [Verrucomicrobiales bacterium]